VVGRDVGVGEASADEALRKHHHHHHLVPAHHPQTRRRRRPNRSTKYGGDQQFLAGFES
jgi:hypothetical protein